MKYRADIDGLRALAVLPVVLFHANFLLFKGGFVGVDIFFVISGYLITGLIAEDIRTGRFSVIDFYERRVRRIFPALYVVLFFTAAAGSILLLPGDLQRMGESLIAAALFSANLFFWKQPGYFDITSDFKPLLHIWSLSVEEQFYFLFPVFLILAWKLIGTKWQGLTWAGLVFSLALSVYTVRHYNSSTFYLLPTRAWELLTGSVIALGAVPTLHNQKIREVIAASGLGMILFAIFSYDRLTLFPGEAAALPCCGAGLIIYSGLNGQKSFVNSLLAGKYPVFIGLISYSLYLWHWPLLVFVKHYSIDPLTDIQAAGVVLISGIVAYLSWKFVERPFRWKDGVFATRRPLFLTAGAAMILAIMLGAIITHAKGFPARISNRANAFDAVSAMPPFCDNVAAKYDVEALCQLGPIAETPEILVWGDSHAQAIAPAFADVAKATGQAILLTTSGGCLPFLDVYNTAELPAEACPNHNKDVFHLIQKLKIKQVYLVGRWPVYALGNPPSRQPQRPVGFIKDAKTKKVSPDENKAVFARGFDHTLTLLEQSGIKVTVLGSVPLTPYNVPRTLARADMYGRYDEYPKSFPVQEYYQRVAFVKSVFAPAIQSRRIQFYDLAEKMCDTTVCHLLDGDTALYVDDNHITEYAAKKYVADLTKRLTQQER